MADAIWSEEAEKSVLGACLISGQAVVDCIKLLRPEMFYLARHRQIFRAIAKLFSEDKPIDFTTVAEALGPRLKPCGGYSYLAELGAFVPGPSQAEAYARIVRDKFVRRRLVEAGKKFQELAVSEDETDVIMDRATATVFELANERSSAAIHIGDVAIRRWDELYRTRETGVSGTPTGFRDLDAALGGLQPSDLIILAGRTSMGKTALGLQIAYQVARNEPVLFVSLEMSASQIAERLICAEANLDSQTVRVRRLSEYQWDRGWEAASRVAGASLWIDDNPDATTVDIRAKARRLKADKGLALVVIDYLQLLCDEREKGWSRNEQVGAMTRRLKAMARDLEIPVLCLSQLNRQVEQRQDKKPTLADLRDSGSIEQDADVVLFVHRPEYYNPKDQPGVAEIVIAKQRNGPTGVVRLRFDKRYARFAPLSLREEGAA